jgi:predicted RNA binding protein YcfA (HicA-like mRNA interferase family)
VGLPFLDREKSAGPAAARTRADVTGTTYARNVKVREMVRLLEDDGWRLDRQRGSHRQFRHPEKPGTVTIAGNPVDELKPGTLSSVLRQAGLRRKR